MKCLVLIREVPDTEAQITVAGDGKSINTADIKYILNPYDEYAIEAASLLAEEKAAEVILVAVGNANMSKTISNALAKAADKTGKIAFVKAIHLVSNDYLETHSVADEVSKVILEEKPDIVFLGKQYIDDDDYLMSAFLANKTQIKSISVVTKVEYSDTQVDVKREIEGGSEMITVNFPVILSLQKGVNEPRYAGMKGIMNAKKVPVESRAITLSAAVTEIIKIEPPAPKSAGRKFSGDNAVAELVKALKEEAKVI